jgi:hypothetical protein
VDFKRSGVVGGVQKRFKLKNLKKVKEEEL